MNGIDRGGGGGGVASQRVATFTKLHVIGDFVSDVAPPLLPRHTYRLFPSENKSSGNVYMTE